MAFAEEPDSELSLPTYTLWAEAAWLGQKPPMVALLFGRFCRFLLEERQSPVPGLPPFSAILPHAGERLRYIWRDNLGQPDEEFPARSIKQLLQGDSVFKLQPCPGNANETLVVLPLQSFTARCQRLADAAERAGLSLPTIAVTFLWGWVADGADVALTKQRLALYILNNFHEPHDNLAAYVMSMSSASQVLSRFDDCHETIARGLQALLERDRYFATFPDPDNPAQLLVSLKMQLMQDDTQRLLLLLQHHGPQSVQVMRALSFAWPSAAPGAASLKRALAEYLLIDCWEAQGGLPPHSAMLATVGVVLKARWVKLAGQDQAYPFFTALAASLAGDPYLQVRPDASKPGHLLVTLMLPRLLADTAAAWSPPPAPSTPPAAAIKHRRAVSSNAVLGMAAMGLPDMVEGNAEPAQEEQHARGVSPRHQRTISLDVTMLTGSSSLPPALGRSSMPVLSAPHNHLHYRPGMSASLMAALVTESAAWEPATDLLVAEVEPAVRAALTAHHGAKPSLAAIMKQHLAEVLLWECTTPQAPGMPCHAMRLQQAGEMLRQHWEEVHPDQPFPLAPPLGRHFAQGNYLRLERDWTMPGVNLMVCLAVDQLRAAVLSKDGRPAPRPKRRSHEATRSGRRSSAWAHQPPELPRPSEITPLEPLGAAADSVEKAPSGALTEAPSMEPVLPTPPPPRASSEYDPHLLDWLVPYRPARDDADEFVPEGQQRPERRAVQGSAHSGSAVESRGNSYLFLSPARAEAPAAAAAPSPPQAQEPAPPQKPQAAIATATPAARQPDTSSIVYSPTTALTRTSLNPRVPSIGFRGLVQRWARKQKRVGTNVPRPRSTPNLAAMAMSESPPLRMSTDLASRQRQSLDLFGFMGRVVRGGSHPDLVAVEANSKRGRSKAQGRKGMDLDLGSGDMAAAAGRAPASRPSGMAHSSDMAWQSSEIIPEEAAAAAQVHVHISNSRGMGMQAGPRGHRKPLAAAGFSSVSADAMLSRHPGGGSSTETPDSSTASNIVRALPSSARISPGSSLRLPNASSPGNSSLGAASTAGVTAHPTSPINSTASNIMHQAAVMSPPTSSAGNLVRTMVAAFTSPPTSTGNNIVRSSTPTNIGVGNGNTSSIVRAFVTSPNNSSPNNIVRGRGVASPTTSAASNIVRTLLSAVTSPVNSASNNIVRAASSRWATGSDRKNSPPQSQTAGKPVLSILDGRPLSPPDSSEVTAAQVLTPFSMQQRPSTDSTAPSIDSMRPSIELSKRGSTDMTARPSSDFSPRSLSTETGSVQSAEINVGGYPVVKSKQMFKSANTAASAFQAPVIDVFPASPPGSEANTSSSNIAKALPGAAELLSRLGARLGGQVLLPSPSGHYGSAPCNLVRGSSGSIGETSSSNLAAALGGNEVISRLEARLNMKISRVTSSPALSDAGAPSPTAKSAASPSAKAAPIMWSSVIEEEEEAPALSQRTKPPASKPAPAAVPKEATRQPQPQMAPPAVPTETAVQKEAQKEVQPAVVTDAGKLVQSTSSGTTPGAVSREATALKVVVPSAQSHDSASLLGPATPPTPAWSPYVSPSASIAAAGAMAAAVATSTSAGLPATNKEPEQSAGAARSMPGTSPRQEPPPPATPSVVVAADVETVTIPTPAARSSLPDDVEIHTIVSARSRDFQAMLRHVVLCKAVALDCEWQPATGGVAGTAAATPTGLSLLMVYAPAAADDTGESSGHLSPSASSSRSLSRGVSSMSGRGSTNSRNGGAAAAAAARAVEAHSSPSNVVAAMAAAWQPTVYILDFVLAMPADAQAFAERLRPLLESPYRAKVVHGAGRTGSALAALGIAMHNIIDTQVAFGLLNLASLTSGGHAPPTAAAWAAGRAGVQAVREHYGLQGEGSPCREDLEQRLKDRGVLLQNAGHWTRRPLTEDLLSYAVADVRQLLALSSMISADLQRYSMLAFLSRVAAQAGAAEPPAQPEPRSSPLPVPGGAASPGAGADSQQGEYTMLVSLNAPKPVFLRRMAAAGTEDASGAGLPQAGAASGEMTEMMKRLLTGETGSPATAAADASSAAGSGLAAAGPGAVIAPEVRRMLHSHSLSDVGLATLEAPAARGPPDGDADVASLLTWLPPSTAAAIAELTALQTPGQKLAEVLLDEGRAVRLRYTDGCTQTLGHEAPIGEALRLLSDGLATSRGLPGPAAGSSGGSGEQLADLALGPSNRVLLPQSLHRAAAMRDGDGHVVSLTYRVGRHVPGVCGMALDLLMAMLSDSAAAGSTGGARTTGSLLVLGRPGTGKTTLLRDIARLLADECSRNVLVLDTAGEISGACRPAHPGMGGARRVAVPNRSRQPALLSEAVHNHAPDVVVVDDVAGAEEAAAVAAAVAAGVLLVVGVQAPSLVAAAERPDLAGFFRQQPVAAGRSAMAPAFGMAVELLRPDRWRVHPSVTGTLQAAAAGQAPPSQLRSRASDGSAVVQFETPEAAAAAGVVCDAPATPSAVARSTAQHTGTAVPWSMGSTWLQDLVQEAARQFPA